VDDFDGWYRMFHPRLVTVLVAVVGDADVATDAADEALVRALENWPEVAAMSSRDGWTYRVGLNVARRRLRRRAIEQRLLRRSTAPGPIPGPTGEIWELVGRLGARQREAVVLRHVGALTEPEIAQVMGIARGTVNATLRAAHRRLRTALAEASTEGIAPAATATNAAPLTTMQALRKEESSDG
jgi:RNA polymerase sigma-70 factor (ECF subfamily)